MRYITAEWVGGPDDGKVVSIPEGTRWVRIAQPYPVFRFAEDEYATRPVTIRESTCDVIPGGRHGHRIIWRSA